MVIKEKGRFQETEGTQETPCGVLEMSHGVSVRAWARKDRNGKLGILELTQTRTALSLHGPGARAVKGSRRGSACMRTGQIVVIGFPFLQLFGGSKIISK